jgi:hypothetical protein
MISEEDKEMVKYLEDVHNLANKGIKGRGKGRKVQRLSMHQQHQQQQQPQPTHHGLLYYDLSYPAAYSPGGYSMHSDPVNDTSSARLEAGYGDAYLEDQWTQELAFADRLC